MIVEARATSKFETFTVVRRGNCLKIFCRKRKDQKKRRIGLIDMSQHRKCFSCCNICIDNDNDEHFLLIGCADGSVISYGLCDKSIQLFSIMENAHPDAIITIAFHIPASASRISFMVAGIDFGVSVWEDHPDERYFPRLMMRV